MTHYFCDMCLNEFTTGYDLTTHTCVPPVVQRLIAEAYRGSEQALQTLLGYVSDDIAREYE